MTRRVVITGMGFVLPVGTSPAAAAAMLSEPRGPFVRSQIDPEVAVCPVPDFQLRTYTGRFKNARYLSRGQQLCLAAATLAVNNAELTAVELNESGLFLGVGPNLEARPRTDRAVWLLDYLPNTLAAAMAGLLGMHGENLTVLTACAASTQALGQAYRAIASGICDRALAGGGDSRLSAEGIAAYKQAGVLATGWTDPTLACRPFDQNRSGFAIGEGAAMFVLETPEQAQASGRTILAEICGASSSMDGASLTGPDPNGIAAGRAVAACLQQLGRDELCILAHGTGTLLNDEIEAHLMAALFPDALAICAFKSRIGHLAAACGAAELALALCCATSGTFPGIAGLGTPVRSDLPLLRTATPILPERLLLQSFGFGGQNACLGVRPWS